MKKLLAGIFSVALAFTAMILPPSVENVFATEKSAADYSYTITPILAPFNEYFFVKTDNPDPTSFRFVDKSSKYSEESCISLDWDDWDNEIRLYADIKYDNKQTGRVNGGYIFKSFDTDGGEIVLQSKDDSDDAWYATWSDTKVKLKLPVLKDDVDYLIDTYAVKSGFFDNMDAVQEGFTSICLYSGSFIRGELYKVDSFWSLSSSPHKDQNFYLQSPYDRKDSKRLFATAIYPYRFDSLGFPSVMATVSKRLNSASTYEWDNDYHCYINVTYGGETKCYGGAGNVEGQGISMDKIKQYFTFGTNGTKITLKSAKELLVDYAVIKMNDDVPRANALTWESVCDKVGNGAWVRLTGIGSIFGGTFKGYSYLYKKEDGKYHFTEPAGSNGAELYWSGDLGYASDTWVDGRYVGPWEVFIQGDKFEDHPTSNILLRNVKIPQITYDREYNYYTGEYEYRNFQITEKAKTVKFYYSEDEKIWIAGYDAFDEGCAGYDMLADFVENGQVDKKYLDMVTLTLDEVKALKVDRNTNTVPTNYFIYDGTAEPGTSIKNHKHSYKSEITKQASCTTEGIRTYTCSICEHSYTETIKKTHNYKVKKVVAPTYAAQGYTIYKCSVCGASYKGSYTQKKTVPVVNVKSDYTSTTDTVRIQWSKVSGAAGYKIYRYDYSKNKWILIKTISDGNTLSYKDSSLKAGKVYKYKIKAFVKSGGTTYSGNYSSIIATATKPSEVKITKVLKGKTYVSLYWKTVTGTGYKIQRYNTAKQKWVDVNTVPSVTTCYKFSGLTKNTSYKFRIRAYKNDGKKNVYGAWSNYTVKTDK